MKFVAILLCLGAVVGVASAEGEGEPAAVPAPAKKVRKTPAPPADDIVTLNAGGDISYPNGWAGEDTCDALGAELFASIKGLLDEGDINFANLETPFTDAGPAVEKK